MTGLEREVLDTKYNLADKGAHLLALDVANKESCEAAVQSVLTEQGRMDILINKCVLQYPTTLSIL